VLVWLSAWTEVQTVCIWSSWCYCHPRTPSSLASFKSRLVLPLWYRRTQVVLEKRPLNRCSGSWCMFHFSLCYPIHLWVCSEARRRRHRGWCSVEECHVPTTVIVTRCPWFTVQVTSHSTSAPESLTFCCWLRRRTATVRWADYSMQSAQLA